jgi:hypothetical protein
MRKKVPEEMGITQRAEKKGNAKLDINCGNTGFGITDLV